MIIGGLIKIGGREVAMLPSRIVADWTLGFQTRRPIGSVAEVWLIPATWGESEDASSPGNGDREDGFKEEPTHLKGKQKYWGRGVVEVPIGCDQRIRPYASQ